MSVIFLMTTIVLYFIGTGFFLAYLVRRSEALSRVSLIITGIGFLSHSMAVVARMMADNHVLLTSSHDAISFFSWALVLVFLIVELRHRIHILGSFILPLALISLVSAAALPTEVPTLEPVLKTVWLHDTGRKVRDGGS